MADCACVWVGDYDEAERTWTKVRTARKPNTCGECRRPIAPGEKYEHVRQLYDGDWSTNATCLDCVSVRESFFCNGWLYGGVLDDLREHIEELHGEVASECLAPLTSRAREMVCEMIEKAWPEDDCNE